ncbi:TonB-dependent receptor [candidate division KSB1 bacterium]|nr:TonB-dependent receptor [candidate division KSB1 bacterium]
MTNLLKSIRRLFILWFFILSCFTHSSYSQTLTLQRTRIQLRDALDLLTTHAHIFFIYDDVLVDQKIVSFHFTNQPVSTCLDSLLTPFNIQYKQVNSQVFLLYKNNRRTVIGEVFDAITIHKLAHANVYVEGTTLGTTTNNAGKFKLTIPVEVQQLTISYMGYQTRHIMLYQNSDDIDVSMNPIVIPLQPVTTEATAIQDIEFRVANEIQRNEQNIGLRGMASGISAPVKSLPQIDTATRYVEDPDDPKKGAIIDYNAIEMLLPIETVEQKQIQRGQFRDDLIMVDGIRFYEAFHTKLVPGTHASMYSYEMLDNADYVCGGFDVNYWDAYNSMLSMNYQDNSLHSQTGKVEYNFSGQEIFLSHKNNQRLVFMLHAKNYNDRHLASILKNDRKLTPRFIDVQSKLRYEFTPTFHTELFYLRSNDKCEYAPTKRFYKDWQLFSIYDESIHALNSTHEYREDSNEYDTQIVSLKSHWDLQLNSLDVQVVYQDNQLHDWSKSQAHVSSAFVEEPRYVSEIDVNENYDNTFNEKSIHGTIKLASPGNKSSRQEFGFTFNGLQLINNRTLFSPMYWNTNLKQQYLWGSFDWQHPMQGFDTMVADTIRNRVSTLCWGMYVLNRYAIRQRVFLNFGGRFDFFNLNQEFSFNPRIRCRIILNENLTLNLASGLYTQTPSIQQIKYFENMSHNTKNQNAIHYIASLEAELTPNLSANVDIIYKQLRQLIPISRLSDGSLVCMEHTNNRTGEVKSVRLSSCYRSSKFSFQCAYTYQQANEQNTLTNISFPRYNDQRHNVYANVTLPLWKDIKLMLHHYYSSGYAYIPYSLVNYGNFRRWEFNMYNSDYFPAYHRTDLQLEKSFSLFAGELELFVKLINIFNRQNVFAYSYGYDGNGIPERKPQVLFGLVPFFGCSYTF